MARLRTRPIVGDEVISTSLQQMDVCGTVIEVNKNRSVDIRTKTGMVVRGCLPKETLVIGFYNKKNYPKMV